jgi:hypothetical protein
MKDEKPYTKEQIRKIVRKEFSGTSDEEIDSEVASGKIGEPMIRHFEKQQKVRDIKSRLIKVFPGKTPDEYVELTQKALDEPEWYEGLKGGNKAERRLRAEYGEKLTEDQAKELAAQSKEPWFQGLGANLANLRLRPTKMQPMWLAKLAGWQRKASPRKSITPGKRRMIPAMIRTRRF